LTDLHRSYSYDGEEIDVDSVTVSPRYQIVIPKAVRERTGLRPGEKLQVLCLYEVFRKVHSVGSEAEALRAVAQMRQGRVVPLTEDLALSAALISLRHGIPMAASMILATARAHDAVLWTQDDRFRDLPGVEYREAASRRSGGREKR